MTTIREKLTTRSAAAEIATILHRLEKDTGSTVLDIELNKIESRLVASEHPTNINTIEITTTKNKQLWPQAE